MSLLHIRNLSVDFATASGQFRAVDAVDINVDTGEILAIVGESGSGKSVVDACPNGPAAMDSKGHGR